MLASLPQETPLKFLDFPLITRSGKAAEAQIDLQNSLSKKEKNKQSTSHKENGEETKGPILLPPLTSVEPQNNEKNIRKKGPWTPKEDELLIEAVKNCKPILWDVVSEQVPGRTPTQCRERWQYRLTPGVDKTKFQMWEDVLILKEQRRIGNRWTVIANKLPGRTVCSVKNRWYLYLRYLK